MAETVLTKGCFSRKEIGALCWAFPYLYFIYFGQARGFLPMSGNLVYPVLLLYIYMGVRAINKNSSKCKTFNVFLLYTLMTFCCYMLIDRPLSLYFNDLIFFVVPMLMVYVGLDKSDVTDKYYNYIFWSTFIVFVIGYYIYFVRPAWFQSFFMSVMNNTWFRDSYLDFEDISAYYRFTSITPDSYYTEYLGMFIFPISLWKMYRNKGKMKMLFFITSMIIMGGILLSLQRAAIISSIIILVVFAVYDIFHSKANFKYLLLCLIIVWILVSVYGGGDVIQTVLFRFTKMNVADSFEGSRNSQLASALSSWQNIPFGNGMGSAGSKARELGFPGISDGNYIKILVEEGVVGLFFFLVLMVGSFIRAFKNFKYLSRECCILGTLILTMTGSNSLMFTYYIVPYWIVLGRIWNPDYLAYLKNNNITLNES